MEHSLADEMDGWLVDDVRLVYLLDKLTAALAVPHPALVPANVMIDDDSHLRLVTVAPSAAPYAAPEAALTERSNVYSLGVILRELLADRPHIAPPARALIAQCTAASPAARPSLAMVREQLAHLGWITFAVGPYRPLFEPTGVECELIAAMREPRADPATPAVYADWLEENGHEARARFLRHEVAEHAPPDDARFRAVVSHAEIASCMKPECPKSWAAVADTALDNVRDCTRCQRRVVYCTSIAEVQNQARRRDVEIAFDASLDRAMAMRMLVLANAPTYVGPPGNPPPPRSYVEGAPPRDNVLTRLFGLFRRR